MGYYTGNGITTSGGSSVSVYETFVFWGAHNVYQQIDSTVTRKSGVSLATAQSEKSAMSMYANTFAWGNATHLSPNCKGTRKMVAWSQINGSNLYELQITNETIKARLDNGAWVS